jgi:hypothetical protein
MLSKDLNSKTQIGFLYLNKIMIAFISKKHILFISKPIWMIFVALNVLKVELQIFLEVPKQHNKDPKILSFKLQIGFISLNQTMTPFTLEEHILFI